MRIGDGLRFAVNRGDFSARSNIESKTLEETFGSLKQQRLFVLDDPANEVWQTAVRVGDEPALFQNYDLRGRI